MTHVKLAELLGYSASCAVHVSRASLSTHHRLVQPQRLIQSHASSPGVCRRDAPLNMRFYCREYTKLRLHPIKPVTAPWPTRVVGLATRRGSADAPQAWSGTTTGLADESRQFFWLLRQTLQES
jgi:hypothetical protein